MYGRVVKETMYSSQKAVCPRMPAFFQRIQTATTTNLKQIFCCNMSRFDRIFNLESSLRLWQLAELDLKINK